MLEIHCIGTQTKLYNDYKFGVATQHYVKDFDVFLIRLLELEKQCGFRGSEGQAHNEKRNP